MYDILELNKKLVPELRDIAKELSIKRVESYKNKISYTKYLTRKLLEAEKNVKRNIPKEQNIQKKEERSSFKSFLRKKQDSPKEEVLSRKEDTSRNKKRQHREREEPAAKAERIDTQSEVSEPAETPVQSRQEEINAIIQGSTRKRKRKEKINREADSP